MSDKDREVVFHVDFLRLVTIPGRFSVVNVETCLYDRGSYVEIKIRTSAPLARRSQHFNSYMIGQI